MTISNSTGEVHPMHLHGHRAAVLSRNGNPACGVHGGRTHSTNNGETYVIAFRADNPDSVVTSTTTCREPTAWSRTYLRRRHDAMVDRNADKEPG